MRGEAKDAVEFVRIAKRFRFDPTLAIRSMDPLYEPGDENIDDEMDNRNIGALQRILDLAEGRTVGKD